MFYLVKKNLYSVRHKCIFIIIWFTDILLENILCSVNV